MSSCSATAAASRYTSTAWLWPFILRATLAFGYATPGPRSRPSPAERPADEHNDAGHGGRPPVHQPQNHGRIQDHQRDDWILRSGRKRAQKIPRGRGRHRQDKEENMTPFHARSAPRTPSLPARIIVTGATSPWECGTRPPRCQLIRGSGAVRAPKNGGGRSRHPPPPAQHSNQGQ